MLSSRNLHQSKSSTLCFLFLTALVFIGVYQPSVASSSQVTLAWNANTEQDLSGYRVYYGLSSQNYPSSVNVGNTTSFTLANLEQGKTYYLSATAYDIDGNESDFSQELVYTAPTECTFSISPNSQPHTAAGGAGTVNVVTQAGCSWTVVSNASSWLIVTSNSSGTGNGTVNYTVLNNNDPSSRTGTLTIANRN